ncbi:DUF2612 domain-containing protein [Oligella urethralis]|uniref:DUF2612 domain-containing protein n=1 Tax=Oligella urethralis TaxID=90245 RepID=UPI002889A075|nr:DUF2612 domain-containing protein [Oligella urethralis]
MIKNIPDRAYSQYRDKPKLMDWLNIARKMGGDICDAAIAVKNSYDIDTAEGVQLDTLGRIVVFPRDFISQLQLDTADFDLSDGAECGDEDAIFSPDTAANDSLMSDGLYRLAIKAKIMRNVGDATIESIIKQMVFLVDPTFIKVNDFEDMRFQIEFSGNITDLERWALLNIDLIQKPQGVQLIGILELNAMVEFDNDNDQFGDDEVMFSDFIGS